MSSARREFASTAQQAAEVVFEIGDSVLGHRDGVVVVIEVYLDESGTHFGAEHVAVAAVWADKSEWSSWTMDWLPAKAPISIHHSVDCHNRRGEYKDWTRERRDAYVMRILRVIRDHAIFGHFASVNKREIIDPIKDRFGGMPDNLLARLNEGTYYICLNWAMRAAWDYLTERGHRNIAFFCESSQYNAEAAQVFCDLQKRFPERSATFALGQKTKYVPLQCADVVAFEGYRQMQEPDFYRKRRKPLAAIDPIGNRFGYLKYSAGEVGPIADHIIGHIERLITDEPSSPIKDGTDS